jgi:hypothetical protein
MCARKSNLAGIVIENVGRHKLVNLTGKQKPQQAAVSGY